MIFSVYGAMCGGLGPCGRASQDMSEGSNTGPHMHAGVVFEMVRSGEAGPATP